MSYLKDDFLLENETAVKLYETYAKDMPIFDYHCHLSEKQILENKRFNDSPRPGKSDRPGRPWGRAGAAAAK